MQSEKIGSLCRSARQLRRALLPVASGADLPLASYCREPVVGGGDAGAAMPGFAPV